MRFSFDELHFSTVYWYPDTNLLGLERRFGKDFIERLFVHTALFEINKIASLRPRILDLGAYGHHHTTALETLWTTIFHKVWAQWRYENGLPTEKPPRWASEPIDVLRAAPRSRDRNAGEMLLFCGGGKDSLVSMKLFERAQIPFASFMYSSSVYGPSAAQFRLVNGLLDHAKPSRRHRQIVMDDFFDAPVIELLGAELGVHTITAAETPSSIFATLPILLDHGYSHAVLGHEASANRGNLIWNATGEDVNHQWGKSVDAERLLDEYVRSHLITDIGVFSVLMPIHDVLIFELLRQDESALHSTHSCNIAKPWCKRCPKCAYVWLNYRAHLSAAPVDAIFPENLLELPENHHSFHDMVGLGEHTPFECIGHLEESRLALALCAARGFLEPWGRQLADKLPPLDVPALLDTYVRVAGESARLPADIAPAILSQMDAAAARCRRRISSQIR